jgi:hypothetical protein
VPDEPSSSSPNALAVMAEEEQRYDSLPPQLWRRPAGPADLERKIATTEAQLAAIEARIAHGADLAYWEDCRDRTQQQLATHRVAHAALVTEGHSAAAETLVAERALGETLTQRPRHDAQEPDGRVELAQPHQQRDGAAAQHQRQREHDALGRFSRPFLKRVEDAKAHGHRSCKTHATARLIGQNQ